MKARTVQQITFGILLGVVVYLDYRVLEQFWEPLAWALILVICFFPVHRRIERTLARPRLAAAISVAVVAVVLILPAILVAVTFLQQGMEVFEHLPKGKVAATIQELIGKVTSQVPISQPDLQSKLGEIAESFGAFLARQSADFVVQFAGFVFSLLVTLLTMFYLFRDGPRLLDFFRDLSFFGADRREQILDQVQTQVKAGVLSNVVVALVQGFLAGCVFWVLSIPAALFWGVISGVLAFLPLIAPALVWLGAAVVLFIQGELWRACAMVVLGTLVISGVDNVLRPAVIAGKSKMNGLLAFIGLFGGIYVFGFLGIVLGPLLAAMTVGILNGYHAAVTEETEILDSP